VLSGSFDTAANEPTTWLASQKVEFPIIAVLIVLQFRDLQAPRKEALIRYRIDWRKSITFNLKVHIFESCYNFLLSSKNQSKVKLIFRRLP
jgi:hypothetical protein